MASHSYRKVVTALRLVRGVRGQLVYRAHDSWERQQVRLSSKAKHLSLRTEIRPSEPQKLWFSLHVCAGTRSFPEEAFFGTEFVAHAGLGTIQAIAKMAQSGAKRSVDTNQRVLSIIFQQQDSNVLIKRRTSRFFAHNGGPYDILSCTLWQMSSPPVPLDPRQWSQRTRGKFNGFG